MTPGKMEITIKISEFPSDVEEVENGWKRFVLYCEPYEVSVTLRPKFFNRFVQQTEEFPEWVAAVRGLMGALTEKGFVLENPGIQVFEKKPKAPKEGGQASENTDSAG